MSEIDRQDAQMSLVDWATEEMKLERSTLKWTDIHSLIVNLKPGLSRSGVRTWIYGHMKKRSAIQADEIKEILFEGRPWEPDRFDFKLQDILECPYFLIDLKKEKEHNPYLKVYQKMQDDYELLKMAAAGDAEAAIEYCKKELAGEIMHGPFAG